MAERSDNTILVQRYAAAWRLAAVPADGQLAAEAIALQTSLTQDNRLLSLLANPTLPSQVLAAALKQVAAKNGFSPVTVQFLFVLAKAGRLSLLPKILTELQLQLDTAAGISHAKLISATQLSADATRDLQTLLGAQLKSDVRLTATVQPELLGGVQIEMNSWLMDASLSGQLSRLERQLKSTEVA